MTLIPIEHERRLASPAEAEACFRAFGEKRVSIRGCHTSDPSRFAALVAAIEPKHEHTISFQVGVLRPTARDALDALAVSRFSYLDVRTTDADLRIWPGLYTWVHSSRDLAATTAALGVPLHEGENTVGDAKVTLTNDGRGYPVAITTPTVTTALPMFRALSGDQLDRGFINGAHEETKPLLLRFLVELAARVDVVLDLQVASARALTELYTGEKLDWQAGGLLVDFPEGRIHGFLVTPKAGDADRAKWLEKVTKALRRAGLE